MARKNLFLGRWIRHGGFWPDPKLRLFRRGTGRVEDRPVHETVQVAGPTATLRGALIHHAYPTLSIYQEHMRRYAALGAEIICHKPRLWLWLNRWLNPPLTFGHDVVALEVGALPQVVVYLADRPIRSEERRVRKECRL